MSETEIYAKVSELVARAIAHESSEADAWLDSEGRARVEARGVEDGFRIDVLSENVEFYLVLTNERLELFFAHRQPDGTVPARLEEVVRSAFAVAETRLDGVDRLGIIGPGFPIYLVPPSLDSLIPFLGMSAFELTPILIERGAAWLSSDVERFSYISGGEALHRASRHPSRENLVPWYAILFRGDLKDANDWAIGMSVLRRRRGESPPPPSIPVSNWRVVGVCAPKRLRDNLPLLLAAPLLAVNEHGIPGILGATGVEELKSDVRGWCVVSTFRSMPEDYLAIDEVLDLLRDVRVPVFVGAESPIVAAIRAGLVDSDVLADDHVGYAVFGRDDLEVISAAVRARFVPDSIMVARYDLLDELTAYRLYRGKLVDGDVEIELPGAPDLLRLTLYAPRSLTVSRRGVIGGAAETA